MQERVQRVGPSEKETRAWVLLVPTLPWGVTLGKEFNFFRSQFPLCKGKDNNTHFAGLWWRWTEIMWVKIPNKVQSTMLLWFCIIFIKGSIPFIKMTKVKYVPGENGLFFQKRYFTSIWQFNLQPVFSAYALLSNSSELSEQMQYQTSAQPCGVLSTVYSSLGSNHNAGKIKGEKETGIGETYVDWEISVMHQEMTSNAQEKWDLWGKTKYRLISLSQDIWF